MRVKPVDGRTIRDPSTGREVKEETTVPDDDLFFVRAVQSGDLVVVDEPGDSNDLKSSESTKSGKQKGGD
jgi:hypothetical protein